MWNPDWNQAESIVAEEDKCVVGVGAKPRYASILDTIEQNKLPFSRPTVRKPTGQEPAMASSKAIYAAVKWLQGEQWAFSWDPLPSLPSTVGYPTLPIAQKLTPAKAFELAAASLGDIVETWVKAATAGKVVLVPGLQSVFGVRLMSPTKCYSIRQVIVYEHLEGLLLHGVPYTEVCDD